MLLKASPQYFEKLLSWSRTRLIGEKLCSVNCCNTKNIYS